MTDSVEKGNEVLLQEYSNFTFQCAACTTEQKFNFNDVHALAKGLRVNCASCDLQLKADACTQGSMNLHIDKHSTYSNYRCRFPRIYGKRINIYILCSVTCRFN